MDLKDRVGLITGAASGIGRAIALRLAARGGVLVIADLNLQVAEATAAEIRQRSGRLCRRDECR